LPVIEIETAREICGGDEERIQILASTLAEEADDLMSKIQHAVESCDWIALRRLAHTMKGSASVFGAAGVMETARRLEQQSDGGDTQVIAPLVSRLELEIARLQDALAEFL
jgi:HPt (histidine-containing phosphotransfer) domain-containing protein